MTLFREAIERYYANPHDPFMDWFARVRKEGGFVDDVHSVSTILTNARFDQGGIPAEQALQNTISVFGILAQAEIERQRVPPIVAPPRLKISNEQWLRLFVAAFPAIKEKALRIVKVHDWSADKLQDEIDQIPWIGPKTARLAVRWIHELMPRSITINMSNARVPVDTLLYRVASRLGILEPRSDVYSGAESPADKKIQQFARKAYPTYPVRIDEPMWRMGRRQQDGGHCYPTNPSCKGYLFESFCPRLNMSLDPSSIGIKIGTF